MKKNYQIGILLIATNKYKQFIEQLLESADKYFFAGQKLNVYLFIDDTSYQFVTPTRINVQLFKIEPLKFPEVTLFRYHIFSQIKKYLDCDYVFYFDIDTRCLNFIGEEILPLELS